MLLQSRPLESKARREIEQCHTLTFAALRTGHHGLLASRFTFHGHCHGASCLAESRIFATAHSRASLPICISMLQRSSENLKVSKGIQGDPLGDPRGWCFNTFNQGSSAWTCPSQVLSFVLLLCWSLLALHSLPLQRSNGVFTQWGAPGKNRDSQVAVKRVSSVLGIVHP